MDENSNTAMTAVYNRIDQYAQRLSCAFALVHHSTKGLQSDKSVTDVGAGAGSRSRATDTHLVLRPHEEDGVVVLDAAVRSWPPIEPRCLRWTFPIFNVADDLDPAALKRVKTYTITSGEVAAHARCTFCGQNESNQMTNNCHRKCSLFGFLTWSMGLGTAIGLLAIAWMGAGRYSTPIFAITANLGVATLGACIGVVASIEKPLRGLVLGAIITVVGWWVLGGIYMYQVLTGA